MILTRPACTDDRAFIVSGWSASLRESRDIPLVPMAIYADTFRPIIARHLDRVRVTVAHGETGVLFGFIAFDPSIYVAMLGRRRVTLDGYVLYVYVASPFRRRGVARRLFEAAGISPTQRFGYACRTQWSWELRSKIPLAEYEPKRARYEETEHGRRQAQVAREPEGSRPDPAAEDLAP
jgi:GNAT superfamily N-acetyltransferase